MNELLIKKTTKEHYEKYQNSALIYKSLWLSDTRYMGYSKKHWIESFKEDPNLNQLGNQFFDKFFPLYQHKGINSLSANICSIKHYIIYHVIEAIPEFVESV